MYVLLLPSSLLHITTGSVYNVTPDDHYYPNTTCHHCHNLQHYLLNTTKYFPSNTQLLFLPGLHHLHTDLIIQNVHNISLIGNGTTPDTVIQCNSSIGIVMTNITNLIVTNITVRSCLGNEYNNATILIKQCTNVQLRHVVIEESHNSYGIVGINILGDSHFSYITNNAIIIIYNDTTVDMENHSLTIDHYHVNDVNGLFQQKVKFELLQQTYRIEIHLFNSEFQWLKNDTVISIDFNSKGVGHNILLVKHCQFANNNMPSIRSNVINTHRGNLQQDDGVWFQNCEFFNNQITQVLTGIIHVLEGPNIHVSHCSFHHNSNSLALRTFPQYFLLKFKVFITNTLFSSSVSDVHLLEVSNAEFYLIGPVTFYNISNLHSVIKIFKTTITFSNYIEFVNTSGDCILEHYGSHMTGETYASSIIHVFVKEGTIINITHNEFKTFANFEERSHSYGMYAYNYPPCYFQYLPDAKFQHDKDRYGNNFIRFDNNFEHSTLLTYKNLPLIHCSWLQQSAFNTAMPLEINKKYIKYINKSGTFDMLPQHIRPKTLCYCDANNHYDCHKELLDPIYPGQTMELRVYTNVIDVNQFDTMITVGNNITWLPPTACVITDSSEMVQISKTQICTTLKYTIAFPTEDWCELFMKGSRDGADKVDIYYIKEKPCPVGFTKLNGICQCYQFLKQFSIKCNINDQTIWRPANLWISPILNNNKSNYSYKLSVNCPFHHCLPRPSKLSFSTPNSQCQFNRSGILCGHCQKGLSTVFGSSYCQHCSNIYLFLIVPIAIAGLVLVLLLFILNLTVTDGTINAFILYVNIVSINNLVFFSRFSGHTAAYTFISLANLDLGIQTCFYNGMDDYAKMWLELAFPFYLIFIATSLIITSRYSTTIQRLTARRALPVLATLFLLSYTKILLIISRVLFSYTNIIHLPSGDAKIAWSVDANVLLLSVRFITLFIVCFILFLILVPFNIILLFTRSLSRFTMITKFKPLLDAYQGPYKDTMYYWVGLQLGLRVVFFAMSSLNRNINLIIGIVLFSLIQGLHGALRPFKNDFKNYHEQCFTINNLVLFAIAQYSQNAINTIAVNVMIGLAMVHFSLIIVYHIITHAISSATRNILLLQFSKLTIWMTRLQREPRIQQFELNNNVNTRIPEAVSYHEYREPLLGHD